MDSFLNIYLSLNFFKKDCIPEWMGIDKDSSYRLAFKIKTLECESYPGGMD
jgi:hypothetical protein